MRTMLITTDTLEATAYIAEQFGKQDVTDLTHNELMSRVESIRSLDTVMNAVANNKDFDLFAVDHILTVAEWVRTQFMKCKGGSECADFKKNAKLFSNFVNRLIEYRIKKYNELTDLNKFLNSYS